LDPDDDDKPDLTVFGGLEIFLDSDMTEEERCHFLEVTAPSMVHKALQLKQLKPARGLHFSLQQQGMRSIGIWVSELMLLGHSTYEPKRFKKLCKVLSKFFIYQLMHKRIALKKNTEIYIKTAPTCFGFITIIRERIIRAC